MKLSFLDKLQLKRIEKKIAKKKLKWEKPPIQLEKGVLHCTKIVLFSSKFWVHENVKKILKSKGYKVVHFVVYPTKLVVCWK